MMQKIKYYLQISLATLGITVLGLWAAVPGVSYAVGEASKSTACTSIGANANCDTGGLKINDVVTWVVNVISWIVGLLAVIMIIISGAKFMTAGGDSGKIASARSALMYAIIGLIIAALAQVIVQFVLAKATGTKSKEEIQQEQQSGFSSRTAASKLYRLDV